jgi:uncharacterized protein (UPF0335 family)
MMSATEATIADDMLRSYFERWQRLEEEKRTIADDLKELFAEAKGNGFDAKVMRVVFRNEVGDQAELSEFEALCDLYRASLRKPRAHPARSARVEIITQIPPETQAELHRINVPPPGSTNVVFGEGGLAEPACAHDDEAANTKSAPIPPSSAPTSSQAVATKDPDACPLPAFGSTPHHSTGAAI